MAANTKNTCACMTPNSAPVLRAITAVVTVTAAMAPGQAAGTLPGPGAARVGRRSPARRLALDRLGGHHCGVVVPHAVGQASAAEPHALLSGPSGSTMPKPKMVPVITAGVTTTMRIQVRA